MTLDDIAADAMLSDACNRIGELEVQLEQAPPGHRLALADEIEILRRRIDMLDSGIEYDPVPFIWPLERAPLAA